MAGKPDETDGSAEIGPAWPVVGRSMINHNAPSAEPTGQFPAPVGSAPREDVRAGARWPRVALVLTGLVLLVAAMAVLVVLVVLPWFS
ncbi:hypothetical protein SAMN05660733_00556 [Lentzea albidocapillata]|uniref:Uncharacterized protein n=2 Tax=Lentzea albidocapillata TaxID=40571 RepID=A0A1W2A9N8_9PSEU|nr:hypothetical protein SAMN05660733_00556 [Lentzea albidocapillata]